MSPAPLKRHDRSSSDDCLGRIPYASAIATTLCCIGVILFSFMMAQAVNASVEQSRRALHVHKIHWLDKVRIFHV